MINTYDPYRAPDPNAWLALDEVTRIMLVMDYHSKTEEEHPGDHMHAMVHTVVENQVALGDETPVQRSIKRLMNEGLDRHDAIHAVGSVLAKYLLKVGKKELTGNFTDDYFEEVHQLTAQLWLDEFE